MTQDKAESQRVKPLRAGWLHFLTFDPHFTTLYLSSLRNTSSQSRPGLAAGVIKATALMLNTCKAAAKRWIFIFSPQSFYFNDDFNLLFLIIHQFLRVFCPYSPWWFPPAIVKSFLLPPLSFFHLPNTLQLLSFYFWWERGTRGLPQCTPSLMF